MSRKLSTRRSRKPRNSPGVRALVFDEETVNDPQTSTSRGYPRLRNAPDPLLYLYSSADEVDDEGADEDYTPPLKFSRTSNLSEVEISSQFNGDDSDWEESESDSGESAVEDSSDVDYDYVPPVDTSLDSDEPLAEYARRKWERNEPRTPSFTWAKEENFVRRHCFEGTPGVHGHLDESSGPMEIFSSLFPELFHTIVDKTNRYARQNPQTPSSHMKGREDTTVREVRSYVGLRFLMGLHAKRCQRDLWSTDPLMCSSVFAKTSLPPPSTSLTTKRSTARRTSCRSCALIDVLDSTYRSVFVPNQNVTVDERLWAFKGRHQALQYNPSKRARRGLKVYKLCSSDGPEAGYTAAFNIYMGQDRSEFPASMKAVNNLMEKAKLLDKGYQLYTDNWYSSPTLFHYLQAWETTAVGTVRINRRGMPSDLQASRGHIDFRSSKTRMLCLQWLDKRPVTMLSTAHTSKVDTLPPNRRGVERSEPEVVVSYNNVMKGVDLSDQLAQSYPATKKTIIKWYKKVIFYLLDMSTINALAVHRALGGKMPQWKFRTELVRELQRGGRPGSFRRNPPQNQPEEDPQQAHMPVDTPFDWQVAEMCALQPAQEGDHSHVCPLQRFPMSGSLLPSIPCLILKK
ncbi:piggyBac transposable element-derived protein 4-like [Penaeus chinensis]|uniref:piggyBac transposable element-derived protein 4-like n=1 Tax=Penaeus chinensis TaxID=139456 RepID=UPI001FB6546C|nr:piggyBac transposable element-derived protein 4-like [Penaeus chinensis]